MDCHGHGECWACGGSGRVRGYSTASVPRACGSCGQGIEETPRLNSKKTSIVFVLVFVVVEEGGERRWGCVVPIV
jgi:hypothetical protein